jgi:photosystem II stability/assembly factor-like uncharacterized protein
MHHQPLAITRATLVACLVSSLLPAQATTAAERAAAWTMHRSMADSSWFRGLAWRAAGPVKIGARIEAIAIPPGNTGTIYAGVGSGNLWKTVNNGLTWRPIFEHESAFAIGDVAVSQSNPDVVWVGTGEAQPRYAGYAYPGTGVFKSLNGGRTWEHMGLGETHHVGKVLIHPTKPNTVYVAAMGRQWSHNRERGVFRTTDGGAHWQHVLMIDDSTGVADLVMDPTNPNRLYAWAWQIEAGTRGGLFMSRDGGTTWRRSEVGLPTGLRGRAGLEVSPSAPNIVYLFLDNRNPSPVKGRPFTGGEVYRSTDFGTTWRKVNTEDLYSVFSVYGWKFTDVRVDPRNPQHLYILGNSAHESFDGGATWRRVGAQILRLHDTEGRALHLDHHELVIDPANPDRLLLGNDGGLFQSYDGGRSWLHLNNIPVVQMYYVGTDDRMPYRIFAGTQDDAALYGPSTASLDDAVADPWRSVYLDRWTGGDSYVTIPDPTDDRLVYYEHQYGEIMRMDITGASVISGGPSSERISPKPRAGEPEVRFSWYTPFFISPHNARTLYAGGTRVMKTMDRGASWTAISPDLGDSVGVDRAAVPTGALTMLMESPRVRGMLAGGTEGGRVWITTDDGGRWKRIDAGLPRKWVSRVTLSSHNPAVMYVSMTGFREDDTRPYIFASSDTGRTWRSIVSNLPQESVNVIKEDPLDAEILYVGTDLGVYVSRNGGERWESLSATLPSTPVQDLAIQSRDNELVIGTHGRGAWILDLMPIRERAPMTASAPLRLSPIRSVIREYHPWETEPGDRRGRNVARMQLTSAVAGAAVVTVSDSTGRVVREWQSPVARGVNTLVWDMQSTAPAGKLSDAAVGRHAVEVRVGTWSTRADLLVLPDPISREMRERSR